LQGPCSTAGLALLVSRSLGEGLMGPAGTAQSAGPTKVQTTF
jgi:hypothetical protein